MKMKYRTGENIYEYINQCKGLKVVYGITFGECIVEEGLLNIDYFCDRRGGKALKGIPIITVAELNKIVREMGKRAFILICVGNNKAAVQSIYGDLCKFDIDADVFDYFDCGYFFRDKSFFYKGRELQLYENIYNCGFANTRMTERSVELSLGQDFLERCDGKVCEIGAVTPYYELLFENKIEHVVDPTDMHIRVDIRKSLFDCDLNGWNVLSISTIEHIGTGDYQYKEDHTAEEAILKILKEAKSCLVTVPIGYNTILDEWIYENKHTANIQVLRRYCNNHWKCVEVETIKSIKYGRYWADGLAVIEK